MDKSSDEYMIMRYKSAQQGRKVAYKKWQDTHEGEAKLYYELNKKRLNLRSAELVRQKNNAKKALKLLELEAREKEIEPIYI
jgi:hypothetical protein